MNTVQELNSEETLSRLFKKLGIISDKFFGELHFKYNDGKIVHVVREQSLKFKD